MIGQHVRVEACMLMHLLHAERQRLPQLFIHHVLVGHREELTEVQQGDFACTSY